MLGSIGGISDCHILHLQVELIVDAMACGSGGSSPASACDRPGPDGQTPLLLAVSGLTGKEAIRGSRVKAIKRLLDAGASTQTRVISTGATGK